MICYRDLNVSHILLLILTGALATNYSSANGDRMIRLDAKGGSMEHVKARQQNGVGNCYAIGGLDLGEAWKFSHYQSDDPNDYPADSVIEAAVGENLRLNLFNTSSSAAAWAMVTGRETSYENYGGDPCDVFDYLVKEGGCAEKELPELQGPQSGILSDRLNMALADFKTLRSLKLIPRDNTFVIEDRVYKFRRLDSALMKSSPMEILEAWLTQTCANQRLRFPRGKCFKFAAAADQYEGIFHKLLTRKHAQPIALGIDVDVLKLGRDYHSVIDFGGGIQMDFPKFLHQIPLFSKPIDDAISGSRGHAVVVIGERTVDGKTQFLLRNSGTLLRYSSDWDWEDDYGLVWVDADILGEGTRQYEFVQRR